MALSDEGYAKATKVLTEVAEIANRYQGVPAGKLTEVRLENGKLATLSVQIKVLGEPGTPPTEDGSPSEELDPAQDGSVG